jgi:hypothetical protein
MEKSASACLTVKTVAVPFSCPYINQEGTFEAFPLEGIIGGFKSGSASFWTTDLAGCGKTRCTHTTPLKFDRRRDGSKNLRMLKKAVQQGRSERRGEAYASVR